MPLYLFLFFFLLAAQPAVLVLIALVLIGNRVIAHKRKQDREILDAFFLRAAVHRATIAEQAVRASKSRG